MLKNELLLLTNSYSRKIGSMIMILRSATKPVSKLVIMNAAFLNHKQATELIDELATGWLINVVRSGLLYVTTSEGRKWLQSHSSTRIS